MPLPPRHVPSFKYQVEGVVFLFFFSKKENLIFASARRVEARTFVTFLVRISTAHLSFGLWFFFCGGVVMMVHRQLLY
jgi:hypothetical protein